MPLTGPIPEGGTFFCPHCGANGGEKRVVRPEHHRRADEDSIGERGLHRQLTFAALTDVERWRSGVGADSRDMGEPFDSGPVCLNCHPPGSFDVYGMKSFPSVLDVKTDRIDRTVSAGKHIGNGPLVVNVDLY